MPRYYVNQTPQPNGDHEVHKETCSYLPFRRTDLGEHASCYSAVQAAKRLYAQSNGCAYCSRECHTG